MPIFVFDPMMQIKWTLILSKIVEVLCKKFFIFKEEEEEEEKKKKKKKKNLQGFTKRAMQKSFSMTQ